MQTIEINLVVAHAIEAKPLCTLFDLYAQPRKGPFPLFQSEQGMTLIVSGMGKLAAASATSYLAGLQHGISTCAWLNVGIAGHQSAQIGSGFLAHKVTDAANGNVWYPPQLIQGLPTSSVITVDQPEQSYPQAAAYDMEAAGFYACASRFTTTELIQVFKIISDNPQQPVAQFHVSQVESLIANKSSQLEKLVQDLTALLNTYSTAYDLPTAYQTLLQQYRLTATQRAQLQRLCERYHALSLDDHLENFCTQSFSSSRQLVTAMESELTRRVKV